MAEETSSTRARPGFRSITFEVPDDVFAHLTKAGESLLISLRPTQIATLAMTPENIDAAVAPFKAGAAPSTNGAKVPAGSPPPPPAR